MSFTKFLIYVYWITFWSLIAAESICELHKTVFTTSLTGIISDGSSNYMPNQRCEWLIRSPNVTRYPYITLKFHSTFTECSYDYIIVHDGDSYSSPLLATLSGGSVSLTSVPSYQLLSRSGNMLIYLFSDMNKEFEGFNASFKISECPNDCSGHGICENNRCVCDENWIGFDCRQRLCYENCGAQGSCRIESILKKCRCNSGNIGKTCKLSLSDDSENWWDLVYDYNGETGSDGIAGHTGVYLDPHFYIFGGFNLNGPVAKLLRYNFQDNEWLLLEPSTQPSARFFHTMTLVEDKIDNSHHLFIYGGDLGRDKLSDETWIFDTLSDSWRKHTPKSLHMSPPSLCQHTATLVEIEHQPYIYIFGGRTSHSRSEGLSSDMYRFDWTMKKWQKVIYDPAGAKSYKLRVAGHTIVYDKLDGTLVLFGGLRMDSEQMVVHSSSVFLYSIEFNRWAEIAASEPLSSATYNIDALAFHTANVVGDYMVVHGGSIHRPEPNLCFSRQTHFYNLRCHAWVKGLLKAKSAPDRVFGHAASVINDSVLLVHGGYNGVMSGKLQAFKLPKTDVDYDRERNERECSRHDEESCSSDYLHRCIWTGHQCIVNEKELAMCGSVCPHLKDCQSCSTFNSYSRNFTSGWIARRCGWCVRDSTCYAVNGGRKLSVCSRNLRKLNQTPQWDMDNATVIQVPDICLVKNQWSGAVAAEYHSTANFSQPDNVSFLTEVDVNWVKAELNGNHMVKIHAFLLPRSFSQKYLQLQLFAIKGTARILLSFSGNPKDLKEIVTKGFKSDSTKGDPRSGAFSEPILLGSLKNSRHYIVVEFNSSTTVTGKVEVEWATSDSTSRSDEFYPLNFANLEPYRGTIQPGSTTSCHTLTNCLACVMDTSCAWCESRSFCVPKTVPAERHYYCSPTNITEKIESAHSGVITVPGSCIVCSDIPTCVQCTSTAFCEWYDSKCLRRGRTANGIKSRSQCPRPCHIREDCASCLADGDENGLGLQCAWCSTSRKCYKFTRYHLAAYSFGQCSFWVDKLDQCQNCSSLTNCNDCLQTHRCGWCSLESNPLKGYCTAGEFSSPATTCRVQHLLNNTLHENDSMNWSYNTCPEINECELLESGIGWANGKVLRPCDSSAKCRNIKGSYLCECNLGFKGDGYNCSRTCLHQCVHGICSEHPNYVCECALGWTSSESSESLNHTACDIDCKCNFLSFCSRGQGLCDSCEMNSTGLNCSECLPGHYHRDAVSLGCYPCQCNGHGNSSSGLCQPDTGICFCEDHTRGDNCELCEDGYFGNPRNGGICYRKCEGRIKLHDEVGAFGIWEKHYIRSDSVMRRMKMHDSIYNVNCEWVIFSSKEKIENPPIIRIEIEKDINIPCYVEKLIVFDGRPDHGDMLLIGEFCGYDWSKSLILYATSGFVTVLYSKLLYIARKSYEGFTIKYEVLSICAHSTLPAEADFVSGDGEYANQTRTMGSTLETTTIVNTCISHACWNNCSKNGVCSMGLCYCHSNYTGLDCKTFKGDSISPITFRVQWSKSHMNEPDSRTGHVFLAMNSLLWLHGGVSNGRLLNDLWSYNVSAKTWSLHQPDSDSPSSRYNHASALNNVKKEFYIYGGILAGGIIASGEMWAFSTTDESWNKTAADLPSLAGHTMTFCGRDKAYIIGGYGKRDGFNRFIYIYDSSMNGRTFDKKSVSSRNLPLFYGHSSTCDLENSRIYVFGGLEATVLKIPELTNKMYMLHTKELKWESIFVRKPNYLSPAPRAFHAAFAVSSLSGKGLIVVGGKVENFEASSELWFFSYKCNNWIKLAIPKDFNFSILDSLPMFPSAAFLNNEFFLYGKMPGKQYESIMLVLSDVEPCFSAKSRDACINLQLGCVPSIFNDSFICSPPSGNAEIECMPFKPDCNSFRNCRSCVDGYKMSQLCHWCGEPLADIDRGVCQPESELCKFGSRVSRRRECNRCSHVPPEQCDSKAGCLWMEAEDFNEHYDKLVKTCTCKLDRFWNDLRATSPAKYFFREPVYKPFCKNCHCPHSCSIHTTCSTCLEVRVSFQEKWRFCMWSQKLGKCLDPASVPLLCTRDGLCGSLASKGSASCPVSRCEEISYCWKCINHMNCQWIQNEHSSGCYDSRNSKNKVVVGTLWYYECPLEDECLNGNDECIEDDIYKEKCEDLPQGYQCGCREGYNRTSPRKICTPTCSQGCFNGTCTAPDTCTCNFGYTGSSCNIACECNGHSNCTEENPSICLKCHNDTDGEHCERCKRDFVGNPVRRESCQRCIDFCGQRSDTCESKTSSLTHFGPHPNDARCVNCQRNSWGDRCERCLDGYFKLGNICHKCQCNGHSETCDQLTGHCKCKNQTTSSDEKCNISIKDNRDYPSDCWKKQCDKCTRSYQGHPENGGYCYKQVSVGQAECISADPSMHCPPSDNYDTVDCSKNPLSNGLPAGQTLLFAINPKYTNVDIRILIDVICGELRLFLTNDSRAFHVDSNETTLKHGIPEEDNWRNASDEVNGHGLKLKIETASKLNSFAKLSPDVALRVDGIKNRLTVTIPHAGFDLKLTKFYMILLGQANKHSLRTSEKESSTQNRNRRAVQGDFDSSIGQLVCRQDQTHIDLFVFFSVFSSCFFLFLSICILTWKFKQAMNMRQARHERDIQMQHMANRPFSTAYVILEDYVPQPLFYSRKHRKTDEYFSMGSNTNGILQLFQASSCPVITSRPTKKICDDSGSSGVNSSFLGSVLSPPGSTCSEEYRASITKSLSSSLNTPCNSGEQLIVINHDSDAQKTAVPFINSMAYIKKDTGTELSSHLLQLSVDCSRSGSPSKVQFHPFQITSNEKECGLSNFEKRKTLPQTMLTSETTTNLIDRGAKSCSTPNLPHVTNTVKKCLPKRTALFKSVDSSTLGAKTFKELSREPRSINSVDMLKPVAFELTEDHCASVNTVLMQLPGGPLTPVSACLGSALMVAQNSGNAVDVPFYKSQIRYRNRKLV